MTNSLVNVERKWLKAHRDEVRALIGDDLTDEQIEAIRNDYDAAFDFIAANGPILILRVWMLDGYELRLDQLEWTLDNLGEST